MKALLTLLLVLGAHFSATALVPAENKAWLGWPFDKETKSIFSFLQNANGTTVTQLLAVIAAACFIAALLCLYGKFVPSAWWPYLIIGGTIASAILYLIHIGPFAIIPILLDAVILYGIFVQHWGKELIK